MGLSLQDKIEAQLYSRINSTWREGGDVSSISLSFDDCEEEEENG